MMPSDRSLAPEHDASPQRLMTFCSKFRVFAVYLSPLSVSTQQPIRSWDHAFRTPISARRDQDPQIHDNSKTSLTPSVCAL